MAWQWGQEASLQINLQLFMQICLHTDNQSHRWGTQGRGGNIYKWWKFELYKNWPICVGLDGTVNILLRHNWNLNSAVEFKLTFPGSLFINWVILTVSNMVYFAVISMSGFITHQCNVTIMSRSCSVGHKMFSVRDIFCPHSCWCFDQCLYCCLVPGQGRGGGYYVHGRY